MSKSLHLKWLAAGVLSASLLSACVGTDAGDDESFQGDVDDVAVAQLDPAVGDVAVGLTADQTTVDSYTKVAVTITLTNSAKHPIQLLSWYTAADELEEDLFEVTVDGERVDYIGPHYKRPEPQKSDYIKLAAGETLTRTVELSGFYDLSKTGDYRVRFAADLRQQSEKHAVTLGSNEVGLWIEGRTAPIQQPIGVGDEAGGTSSLTTSLTWTKCSADQQTTVKSALGAASGMADGAAAYLGGSASGTPRYSTWFGAFSNNGWNTAKSHFTSIKDALDTKTLGLDCGCKKTYYAYVYPAQPYKIYLCKAFWSAPLTGTDSKGGTLIHELSHFTAVAGTDDYIYGQSGAKSLAISSPSQALFNADNHEYFAENTPSQQ